jgi:aspartyl-tRNA(Asn)/glutamyl-tRNA(Gln) amidotransferase subunit A
VDDYTAALGEGVAGMRLGVPRAWFAEGEGTHAETLTAVEAALRTLEGLGATLVDLDGQPFVDARAANHTILTAEGYAYHEHDLKTQPQNFGRSVRSRLLPGALISAADYIQAQRARAAISARIADLMRSVDAVVSPVSPGPADAFQAYDPDRTFRQPNFNNPYNLTGLPAISVPCGFSSLGLPIGLQIATPPFTEALALRIAHAYERATDWHLRRPPLEALAHR